jgi:hypothetical protein
LTDRSALRNLAAQHRKRGHDDACSEGSNYYRRVGIAYWVRARFGAAGFGEAGSFWLRWRHAAIAIRRGRCRADMSKFLGGSDVGFVVPELGYFWGPNLTPDKETGLGNWSEAQILTALRTGTRPDGRKLAPMMPWMAYAKLSDEDAKAIVAYLKSLPPISNKAPGPLGANETPTAAYQQIAFPNAAEPATPPADAAPATPAPN